MNTYILIIVVLIVVCYLRYYVSPNPQFQILQSSITNIKAGHLFEKSPIIIDESIVDPQTLLTTLFRYLYTYKTLREEVRVNQFTQNKCKYIVLYPEDGDAIVQIAHPRRTYQIQRAIRKGGEEDVPVVTTKLKSHQCLILPVYWWYKIIDDNVKVNCIDLDDLLTKLICKF